MIYKKSGILGGGLIGADTKLSVMGAFRIVEDAITEMFGELSIDGITIKKQYNAMWVFAKNRIRFIKPLDWGEKYSVECFITDFSLVRLNVETAVKNACGDIVMYARTELCALDLTEGKIRKTSTVGINDGIKKEPSLIDIQFTKFSDVNAPIVENVTSRSTNIDFSRHTNNVEYIRFVINTYSVEELLNRPIKEIEVRYASQSFENDILQVRKSSIGNTDTVVIEKDGTQVIKCEILR